MCKFIKTLENNNIPYKYTDELKDDSDCVFINRKVLEAENDDEYLFDVINGILINAQKDSFLISKKEKITQGLIGFLVKPI